MKRSLSRCLVLLCAVTFARLAAADSQSHIYITEKSDVVLNISVELAGVNYDLGAACPSSAAHCIPDVQQDPGNPDLWLAGGQIYGEQDSMPLLFLQGTNYVNWVEPNNPHQYNTLRWVPSGNLLITTLVITSDIDAPNYNYLGQENNLAPCEDPVQQPIACPILANGASTEIPLFTYGATYGTITLQFTDLGDSGTVAAPEPTAFLLLSPALAGVGLRRRHKGKAA